MDRKARTAGILSIISGALGILFFGLMLLLMLLMVNLVIFNNSFTGYPPPFPPEMRSVLNLIYSASFIFAMVFALLAIVGGVFAMKRKQWGVALAGAIASLLAFFPCGVAATVLIIQAYNEFQESEHMGPGA